MRCGSRGVLFFAFPSTWAEGILGEAGGFGDAPEPIPGSTRPDQQRACGLGSEDLGRWRLSGEHGPRLQLEERRADQRTVWSEAGHYLSADCYPHLDDLGPGSRAERGDDDGRPEAGRKSAWGTDGPAC